MQWKFSFTTPQHGTYTTDRFSEYVNYIRSNDLTGLALLLLGILAVIILYMAAWCRLFRKAGLPWERMFVPFYSTYWQHRVTGCSILYWVGLVIGAVVTYQNSLLELLGRSAMDTILPIVLLTWFVCYCIRCVKLSRSFGHGVGFGIGLILLNFMFVPILGLGRSEYVGEYR